MSSLDDAECKLHGIQRLILFNFNSKIGPLCFKIPVGVGRGNTFLSEWFPTSCYGLISRTFLKCLKYSLWNTVSHFTVSIFQIKYWCITVLQISQLYSRVKMYDFGHDLSIHSSRRPVSLGAHLYPWRLRSLRSTRRKTRCWACSCWGTSPILSLGGQFCLQARFALHSPSSMTLWPQFLWCHGIALIISNRSMTVTMSLNIS